MENLELAFEHRAELLGGDHLGLVLAVIPALGIERRAQEVGHRDAGHDHRVLQREEHAQARALIDLERQHVLALEDDLATIDRVAGVAHQRVGESRLAGTVGAHHRVHLALVDGERDSLEDLLAFDAGP